MWTLTQTINACRPFIEYNPLSAGTGFEPAASIATTVRNTILNAPFTWGWNRKEDRSLNTAANTQDYTVALTDFGWLERATLIPPGNGKIFEIPDIYNTAVLGVSNSPQRPNGISVQGVTYGTNVKLRFIGVPDLIYNVVLDYQALPIPFQSFAITAAGNASAGNTSYTGTFTPSSFVAGQTALISGFVTHTVNNGEFVIVSCTATTLILANSAGVAETIAATAVNESWAPIPDAFIDIFNTMFLAEAYQAVDDMRGFQYRQRAAFALLSKAEGLTSMQKSDFLAQYLYKDAQALTAQTRTQQGNQARQA